jgi:hypothetical protein
MVDFDAAFGEQLLHVSMRQAEAQVPPHCQNDHIRREPESGEC